MKANIVISFPITDKKLDRDFGCALVQQLPGGSNKILDLQVDRFASAQKDIYVIVPCGQTATTSALTLTNRSDINVVTCVATPCLEASIYSAFAAIGNKHIDRINVLNGKYLVDKTIDISIEHDAVLMTDDKQDWLFLSIGDFVYFRNCLKQCRGVVRNAIYLYCKMYSLEIRRCDSYFDLSMASGYYLARGVFGFARSFNAIEFTKYIVKKSSKDSFKMKAEATWFREVPYSIRKYCPQILREMGEGYTMQNLMYPTLADLNVHRRRADVPWINIISECTTFLRTCAASLEPTRKMCNVLSQLTIEKTRSRLDKYRALKPPIDVDCPILFNGRRLPSLAEMTEYAAEIIHGVETRPPSIMHGDFCFSNILYDADGDRIFVLDPRGFVEPNTATIYGDVRYDLGKLFHSVYGLYDFIIAQKMQAKFNSAQSLEMSTPFNLNEDMLWNIMKDIRIAGSTMDSDCVKAIAIHLFASMVPLHTESVSRQITFIANVCRLFIDLR